MLLVRSIVRPSPIHGTGVFLTEAVRLGQPIWRFQPGFDAAIASSALRQLPELAQEYVHFYAYLDRDTGLYVLNGDHARFMNHSERPNTGLPDASGSSQIAGAGVTTVALNDLPAGTELTCDYRQFDAEYALKFHLPR